MVRKDPLYPDYTFGMAGQFNLAQAALFSNNVEEGVNALVYGSEYYRKNTGRKIVDQSHGFNCLLSDPVSACTVEMIPNRYAVRYPGYLGETEDAYIVETNHNVCEYSYDENDQVTGIPMTRFGNGYDASKPSGLDGSGTRFWTGMWIAKNNFGKMDEYFLMDEFWVRDYYYWENGYKDSNVTGVTTTANKAGAKSGQTDAHVNVPSDLRFYWTIGTPPDWVGPWDSWVLEKNFYKKMQK